MESFRACLAWARATSARREENLVLTELSCVSQLLAAYRLGTGGLCGGDFVLQGRHPSEFVAEAAFHRRDPRPLPTGAIPTDHGRNGQSKEYAQKKHLTVPSSTGVNTFVIPNVVADHLPAADR